MANHIHRQIREAVATALTGLATTGTHVIVNRLYAIQPEQLPAVVVAIDSESIEGKQPCGNGMRMQKRTMQLVIECCVSGSSDIDDSTDQISKEVEIAMSSGIVVGGKTIFPIHTASAYEDQSGGLDVAVKRLSYEIAVHAANSTPDTILQ